MVRFSGMLVVGYLFAALLNYAIPTEEVLGIDWRFLYYLVPFACAFGKEIVYQNYQLINTVANMKK